MQTRQYPIYCPNNPLVPIFWEEPPPSVVVVTEPEPEPAPTQQQEPPAPQQDKLTEEQTFLLGVEVGQLQTEVQRLAGELSQERQKVADLERQLAEALDPTPPQEQPTQSPAADETPQAKTRPRPWWG